MNVKTDSPRMDKLRQIMKSRQGLLLTSDLAHFNIPRTYLSIMEQNGEIERVSRGVYRSTAAFIEDELFSFQSRYSSTIFSHETALYLHDLTDRAPLAYSITVPSGYHSQFLNNSGHKIFYVSRDLFDLGIILMNTPHGNKVRTTDLERTICDIMRSRNQIDIQVRNAALKRYVKNKDRNLDLLYAYAKRFRAQNIVRENLEILL
ncbi:MAG: type IV toxin-antitoxin system AbiEi family antitoxin domain-containing protein [bacterium]|nr:type IV toxin-antitoxin system AbiEi family antitoxin domain-containing protein [bacterium]